MWIYSFQFGKETVVFPSNGLDTLVENYFTILCEGLFLGSHLSFSMFAIMPMPQCLIIVAL